MPPMITRPSRKARPSPEASGERSNELANAPAMPLAWTVGRKVPYPTRTRMEKRTPSQRSLRPFSMYEAGPPRKPVAWWNLYFWARVDSTKAVEAPKKAIIHIQKMAPGPPNARAVATPTILPVPTRPERATQNASNEDIPCCLPSGDFSACAKSERSIKPKRRTCTKLVRKEK